MGDKKKRKQKQKDKKKDKDRKKEKDQKKKKKDRSLSQSSQSQSSSKSSQSSPSVQKRKKKQKKIKKKDKKHKKQTPQKQAPAPSNFPYDFNSVPTTLPGLKNIPAIPPPMPVTQSSVPVPKSRSKQPNIFKLLPKLPYGAVLFAKTIYSSDYLSEGVADKVLIEMTRVLQKTTKQQQHKKGSSIIAKCISDLNKVFQQQKEQNLKAASGLDLQMTKQKSNRYQNLQRVYRQCLQRQNNE